MLERLDDPGALGLALKFQGWERFASGQVPEALALFQQGVEVARKLGPSWQLAANLNDFGFFAHISGDRGPRPRASLEEALQIAREIGDAWVSGITLDSLAQVAAEHADFESAQARWIEAIAIANQLNDRFGLPAYLEGFARLARSQGDHVGAIRLMAAAAHLRQEIGSMLTELEQSTVDPIINGLRDRVGAATFARAWREGTAMTTAQAVATATRSAQPSTAPSLARLMS